ncbi:MAG: flagellar biosynthesis regulator FlaF [Rhodospirillales bacterium]|nr:flagellar biosynthesis regulator FlaF [Alphaproteobacteria bacterium]MCB9987120.1 flagellar biosynthesis regulator FlaF [Rhodospirillales bacterium]USO08122.1 MAG: flagellar biosynthesis regulator FlaF [Rhodospirillales bacterium]
MSKNPHAHAAGKYGKTAKETPDQRDLEGQLLLKAANEIQKLHDNWDMATPEDIDNILTYNRKLWMLFFDTAIENPDDRPVDLRNNIVNLCNFIFKRSLNILSEPSKEKLRVLVDINRQIAAGLMTARPKSADAPVPPPHGQTSSGGTATTA